jgi:hypothetical protein
MPSWYCTCGGDLMIIKEKRVGEKKMIKNKFKLEELPKVPKKPFEFGERDFDALYMTILSSNSASIPPRMRKDTDTIYSLRNSLEERLHKKVYVDEQKHEWII